MPGGRKEGISPLLRARGASSITKSDKPREYLVWVIGNYILVQQSSSLQRWLLWMSGICCCHRGKLLAKHQFMQVHWHVTRSVCPVRQFLALTLMVACMRGTCTLESPWDKVACKLQALTCLDVLFMYSPTCCSCLQGYLICEGHIELLSKPLTPASGDENMGSGRDSSCVQGAIGLLDVVQKCAVQLVTEGTPCCEAIKLGGDRNRSWPSHMSEAACLFVLDIATVRPFQKWCKYM
eukprot:994278-Amphidinium_carterae.1